MNELRVLMKKTTQSWGVVKSTDSSSSGPEFKSQQLHGDCLTTIDNVI